MVRLLTNQVNKSFKKKLNKQKYQFMNCFEADL